MSKSAEAFRTIGEVADDLDVPKHVLRFWEGKFPQIKPMKRGGGRRYYRPEDLELLRGIRHLLHAEGYTIKGVQKILREHGIDQVKRASRAALAAAALADDGRKKRGRKSAVDTLPKPGDVSSRSPTIVASVSLTDAGAPPAAHVSATAKVAIIAAIRELERVRDILNEPPQTSPAVASGANASAPEKRAKARRA